MATPKNAPPSADPAPAAMPAAGGEAATPPAIDAADAGLQKDAAAARGGDDWSDEEKIFRLKFLELSSEGDKQLAYANTTALRTVATEKRLWLKDRFSYVHIFALAFLAYFLPCMHSHTLIKPDREYTRGVQP